MKVSMGKFKTAISVMAFAAVAGTFAPGAHARVIAVVDISGSSWYDAWNTCVAKNKYTRSVKYQYNKAYRDWSGNLVRKTVWNCYDTPNTR